MLDKHIIKQKLETLAYLEMANMTDHFKEVSVWVSEYKHFYGTDDFINTFVSNYLQERREHGR